MCANPKIYLPDIQVRGAGLARIIVVLLEQLSQTDVEGSSDVTDGEAVVRPLSTPLHVTDHYNNRVTNTLVCEFVKLNVCCSVAVIFLL